MELKERGFKIYPHFTAEEGDGIIKTEAVLTGYVIKLQKVRPAERRELMQEARPIKIEKKREASKVMQDLKRP